MTDFIQKLHQHLSGKVQKEEQVNISDIAALSLGIVTDQLEVQYKKFQKSLGKVSEKSRKKLSNFNEEMKASQQKIIDVLQSVHELAIITQKDGVSSANDIVKILEKRIEYHQYKCKMLKKDYPQAIQSHIDEQLEENITTLDEDSTFIMKCHIPSSIQPCTPENDLNMDARIKNSLNELFESLQKSLKHFQNNYSHEADEATNQVINIMKFQYRRAKNKVITMEQCPTIEQIQNIKELETMVRATIQEKIYGIREKQRIIYKSYENTPQAY